MSFNYFKLGNLAGCDDAYLLPQPLEVEAGGLSLVKGLPAEWVPSQPGMQSETSFQQTNDHVKICDEEV